MLGMLFKGSLSFIFLFLLQKSKSPTMKPMMTNTIATIGPAPRPSSFSPASADTVDCDDVDDVDSVVPVDAVDAVDGVEVVWNSYLPYD